MISLAMVNVDPPLLSFPVSWTLATPLLMPRILNPAAPELTNFSPCASSSWVGPANSRCRAPNAVAGQTPAGTPPWCTEPARWRTGACYEVVPRRDRPVRRLHIEDHPARPWLGVHVERRAADQPQAVVEVFDLVVRLGSNVVSFTRLAAFGLTHAALGLLVWEGTRALWHRGGLLAAAAVLVFAAGTALAFSLEALVAAIQALRLEYYELFSRVFVTKGRPFRPWHVPTRCWARRSRSRGRPSARASPSPTPTPRPWPR
jgi:hypothetical protein